MDLLPNETLERILVYVHEDIPNRKRCGAVCWRWRVLMQDIYRRWSKTAIKEIDALGVDELSLVNELISRVYHARKIIPNWFLQSVVIDEKSANKFATEYIRDRVNMLNSKNIKHSIIYEWDTDDAFPFVSHFINEMKLEGATIITHNLHFTQVNGTYKCNNIYLSKRILDRTIIPAIGAMIDYDDFRDLLAGIYSLIPSTQKIWTCNY